MPAPDARGDGNDAGRPACTLISTPIWRPIGLLGVPTQDIFRAFFAVLLANIGLMQAMQAFPDVGKSRAAIQRIFTAVDHRPTIDSLSPSGDELSQVIASSSLYSLMLWTRYL